MTQSCEYVLKKRNITDIPIYELTTQFALEKAKECQASGTKVFVCRGGTAAYLREHLDVPIIDIRHSFLSYFVAIRKINIPSDKIATIGFPQFCSTAEKYNHIMNASLNVFKVTDVRDFESAFLNARLLGAEAVIGGFQIRQLCREYNFPFYSIYPDESEVEQALEEALYSQYVEEEREKQFSIISTILHSSSEGIVGIGAKGDLLHINKIAKELLQYEDGEENPYLNSLVTNRNILRTMKTGEPIYNDLLTIHKLSLVFSCLPIIQSGNITGAVISLQEETNIQIIDSKIRKRQIDSGHYAKMNFTDIIGESDEICKVKNLARKYAQSDSTILLSGETGTGKELFAQSIHNYSMRRHNPFIAINCAALPQSILESELFGYAGGAFTGAKPGGKAGVFEQAHKGTVFLDEVTEIPLEVQAKMLRVLQEKKITRIGDTRIIPVDIRIITASNKNLLHEVEMKKFREDLFYRINVLELKIPSLRERKADIPELFTHFLKGNQHLTEKARDVITSYRWPGNVRQLINITERAHVLSDIEEIDEVLISELIDSKQLKSQLKGEYPSSPAPDLISHSYEEFIRSSAGGYEGMLKELERRAIIEVLKKTNGNREKAAAILGISISTLWRKEKLYLTASGKDHKASSE